MYKIRSSFTLLALVAAGATLYAQQGAPVVPGPATHAHQPGQPIPLQEPNCPYGYYSFAPYQCAPPGFYSPVWFTDGRFTGAGPWYRNTVPPVAIVVESAPAIAGPPVCQWGYYYPYTCPPYGYYGPRWFAGGVFIGIGPWYYGPRYYGGGRYYGGRYYGGRYYGGRYSGGTRSYSQRNGAANYGGRSWSGGRVAGGGMRSGRSR